VVAAYVFDRPKARTLPNSPSASPAAPACTATALWIFVITQGIALEFKESIAPALGMSYGGKIALLPGQSSAEEFSTLVHELAHEMLHKAERSTSVPRITYWLSVLAPRAWNFDPHFTVPQTTSQPRTIVPVFSVTGFARGSNSKRTPIERPYALEHGQLDMAFQIDGGLLPSHLLSERLYREEWICAVACDSGFGDRLTLKQYLEAEHLVVSTLSNVQNIPDKQLAAIGKKRKSRVRLSYFNVALHCLPASSLVLTLTSGMRSIVKSNPHLRFVRAPSDCRVSTI
jgi:hypothetical protein